MRRIAVINQKGGVGKTTTAACLGAAFGARGKRVLLIDLDPQAHLTTCFGIEVDGSDGVRPTVYDVLAESVSIAEASVSARPNVTLVPANMDLASAETELVSVVGREVILRDALRPVADAHDVLLIDCPPSLGLLTINALAACEEVLIPLQAHFLALQGLSKLLETVTLVQRRITPIIRISGIVLCMFDSGTRLAGEVVEDIERFLEASRGTDSVWMNARIYRTRIRRNIKLAEAPSYGQTVFEYAPNSNGALDYAGLADEILAEDGQEPASQGARQESGMVGEIKSATASDVIAAPVASSPASSDSALLPAGSLETGQGNANRPDPMPPSVANAS